MKLRPSHCKRRQSTLGVCRRPPRLQTASLSSISPFTGADKGAAGSVGGKLRAAAHRKRAHQNAPAMGGVGKIHRGARRPPLHGNKAAGPAAAPGPAGHGIAAVHTKVTSGHGFSFRAKRQDSAAWCHHRAFGCQAQMAQGKEDHPQSGANGDSWQDWG